MPTIRRQPSTINGLSPRAKRSLYQSKKRRRDGRTHVVSEPVEVFAKLAGLIPAPRVHLVRYHSVPARSAPWRDRIAPQPNDAEDTARPCAQKHSSLHPATSQAELSSQSKLAITNSGSEHHYSWAELMHRVCAIEVLGCPRCQGPMKVLTQIHPPDTTRKILQCRR